MEQPLNRLFELNLPKQKSAFLWGPRKTGKSFWIRHHIKNSKMVNLLDSTTFAEYSINPSLLIDRFKTEKRLIVIDEIQKVPALLDSVHLLIEEHGVSFLMTGSSARKLRKSHANLLGGRAYRRQLTPLTLKETRSINSKMLEMFAEKGGIPDHFLSARPKEELRSYVADYLKEEIVAEAAVQNLPAFSDFLRACALSTGGLIDYTNIGSECSVSAKVVRGYFQILEDTFLGFRLAPWKKSNSRRMIQTEKFYLFDVGVTNYLAKRAPKEKTTEFGISFEQMILLELKAYQAYRNPEMDIHFWRSSNDDEVDFVLNEKSVAIEAKGSARLRDSDLKGLQTLQEDGKLKRKIIVCLERERRTISDIEILPIHDFVEELWSGEIV
jgi:predicted AAA+ superfamily ATPase